MPASHSHDLAAWTTMVNAKLVLLLANHIGDAEVLAQALAAARDGVGPAP